MNPWECPACKRLITCEPTVMSVICACGNKMAVVNDKNTPVIAESPTIIFKGDWNDKG